MVRATRKPNAKGDMNGLTRKPIVQIFSYKIHISDSSTRRCFMWAYLSSLKVEREQVRDNVKTLRGANQSSSWVSDADVSAL